MDRHALTRPLLPLGGTVLFFFLLLAAPVWRVAIAGQPAAPAAERAEPPPAPAVPLLRRAVAELAGGVEALGQPTSRYVLTAAGDSLLAGYVAELLRVHLALSGLETRSYEGTLGKLDPEQSDRLPDCLVQELGGKTADLFVCCAATLRGGLRSLTVAVYEMGGSLRARMRTGFRLAKDQQALLTAEPAQISPADRDWLELFGRMFPAADVDGGSSETALCAAEAGYFMRAGLWRQAADTLVRIAAPEPSERLMQAVFSLQLAGSGKQAASLVTGALQQYPDSGPLYALRSWVSLRQGRPEDAVMWLEQARLADMAREGLYRYARALLAIEQGDSQTARNELERAARLTPTSLPVQLQLARSYRDAGELDKALSHYRLAAASPGSTAETWAELAVMLDAAGRTQDAIEALKQAFRMRTDSAGITRHLALLLKRQGQFEEALDVLRRSAEANPCSPALLAAYADAATEMWRIPEAERAYMDSVSVNGLFPYGEVGLARVLARQRRYQEARSRLTDLLAIRPDYQPARIELARILGELGHLEEALSLLTEASKSPEHEAAAHRAMARVYLNAGRGQEAVQAAQIAAFSRPDAVTYALLARAFLSIGETKKAETAAASALEKDPLSPEAHLAMARVRAAQDRTEDARQEAERAIQLYPCYVEALAFSAELAEAAGQFRRSVERYESALSLNPWDAELHYAVAGVLGRGLGEWEGALKHYQRYVELEQVRSRAAR